MLFFVKNGLKHTTIDILLVGEDEKDDVAHFAVLDDTAEFGFGFFHAGPVARVDYEDESVGTCKSGSVSLWFRKSRLWLAFKGDLNSGSTLNSMCLRNCITWTYQRSSVSRAA